MKCENCFFGGVQISAKGPIDSPFVIVGESPGAIELAYKKPFLGPAGELLDQCLQPFLHMLDVEPYITNAMMCMPRQKDPNRLSQACQRCNPRLEAELKQHPRKVILALGNAAVWTTTGQYGLKITQERGKIFKSPYAELGVVAAVHPSFLLRGGGNLQQFKRDILAAVTLYRGEEATQTETVAIKGHIRQANKFTPSAYTILETKSEVDELARRLKDVEYVASDTETDGFNPRQREIKLPSFVGKGILSLGVCFEKDHTYVIPGELVKGANHLFENKARWCWHNGKYDIGWLREYDCPDARVDDDTMLMSYLLNEKGGVHDLEQVGHDWLMAPNYKGMLEEYLPTRKHSYAHIPTDVLYKYQAIDTNLTFWLRDTILPHILKDPKLKRVYEEIIIPGSEFVHRVERNGFYVDEEKVKANIERLGGEADKAEAEFVDIATKAGHPGINIRSPLQLGPLLYSTLKLGQPSWGTDKDTLERLPPHPAVIALKKYRGVHKQLSTFVNPILEKREADGRIHTTFKLHGTTTGRLSSNKPNMQNIPRDKDIRGQFIATPGNALMEIDLSQAELRMLASLSGDVAMLEIFNTGKSLHDEVATFLFGPNFNKEQKMIAKNVNFGIVYGITATGLLDQLEVGARRQGGEMHFTIMDAQAWINGWMKRFPQAAEFIEKCRSAPIDGYTLISAFGRKRRFGVVGYDNIRGLQNEAANFPHQSGAHDITLLSGIALEADMRINYSALIVNEVHDCLVFDIKNDLSVIIPAARKVVDTMQSIPRVWGLDKVPFAAEVELGTRWGNCKGIDLSKFEDIDINTLKGLPYEEAFKLAA